MGHLLDLMAAPWSPWHDSVFGLFPPGQHADAVYKLADKYDVVGPVCHAAAFNIHQRMLGPDELHFDCLKWAVTAGDLRLAKSVLNHTEMFDPIDWDRKQIEMGEVVHSHDVLSRGHPSSHHFALDNRRTLHELGIFFRKLTCTSRYIRNWAAGFYQDSEYHLSN